MPTYLYFGENEFFLTRTIDAYTVLIDYTGNHTRLIFTELEKLKTYALGKTVKGDMVKELVSESATNSLQLANAIRLGNIAQALELSVLQLPSTQYAD